MKSPFRSTRSFDDLRSTQNDRLSELQLIWKEIGDDTRKKLDDLSQTISTAVNEVYKKVFEDSLRQKRDLEDMVSKSEARLKEVLGPGSVQVIAHKELPLRARFNINISRLEELDTAKFVGHSWVGGRVVLVKLLVQILSLRDILKFPACNSVDLDEVLESTINGLTSYYPSLSASFLTHPSSKLEEKPVFERLQHFYHMLCSIDSALMGSFDSKDMGMHTESSGFLKSQVRQHMQDSTETTARKRNLDAFFGENYDLLLATSTFGSTPKRGSAKTRHRSDNSQDVIVYSDAAALLEQLCLKVARKLDDFNEHIKATNNTFKSSSLSTSYSMSSPSVKESVASKKFSTPSKTPLSTRTSLEDKSLGTRSSIVASPNVSRGLFSTSSYQGENINDKSSESKEEHTLMKHALTPSFSTVSKLEAVSKETQQQIISSPSGRCPLSQITNNQNASMAPLVAGKTAPVLLNPPSQASAQAKGPPPPPPPPPRAGVKGAPLKTIKLKRSSTISRLYIGMKKKVEGAASIPHPPSDGTAQRRTPVCTGTREGMAEALAEITRRSSYFRKIEDDVQKHAKAINEVKCRLESFGTDDMGKLLEFHRAIESHLEQLTDESQVLARFQDFPVKKLETLRAAASLFSRLISLKDHIESWAVHPPMLEQVDKVTAFFEKVKTDVEVIERTKDEDLQRFRCLKVNFSYDIVSRIKESAVNLSSRCLAESLKESQRTRASVTTTSEDEYMSAKHLNKLKPSFQMLYKSFQLAFKVHNFAGGHDDKAEQLSSDVAHEMDSYPSSLWSDLVTK